MAGGDGLGGLASSPDLLAYRSWKRSCVPLVPEGGFNFNPNPAGKHSDSKSADALESVPDMQRSLQEERELAFADNYTVVKLSANRDNPSLDRSRRCSQAFCA